MKKLLLSGILALLMAGMSYAQGGPGRQPMPIPVRVDTTINRLKPELNLTEKQVADLKPIYTQFYTSLDSIRATGERPTPETRQALMDSRNNRLKLVLSEEQMKLLAAYEEKMRQNRPQGGPGGPPGGGGSNRR
jgi:hypothetical protein